MNCLAFRRQSDNSPSPDNAAGADWSVMRFFVLCLLLVMVNQTASANERLAFVNGKVSIEMPDGFKRMSPEMAAAKYPRGVVPEHIFSDSTTNVSVAAGFTPQSNLSAKDLPQLKDYLQKTFDNSMPV
jgi:hypothetical protein